MKRYAIMKAFLDKNGYGDYSPIFSDDNFNIVKNKFNEIKLDNPDVQFDFNQLEKNETLEYFFVDNQADDGYLLDVINFKK